MKTEQNFGLMFFLLTLAQMVIYNYFHLTSLVVLSIFPAMILCVPLSINSLWLMFIAFLTGLGADILADGVFGLNAFALVPVALLRNSIISLCISSEVVERKESFNWKKNGFSKISLAILFAQVIFFVLYLSIDGAGVRSFGFNVARFFCSILCSYILSIAVVRILTPDGK